MQNPHRASGADVDSFLRIRLTNEPNAVESLMLPLCHSVQSTLNYREAQSHTFGLIVSAARGKITD